LTFEYLRACNFINVIRLRPSIAKGISRSRADPAKVGGCREPQVSGRGGFGMQYLGVDDGALCAQTDPEAFFPEKGGSTREAKKVCLSCDVRAECLEYALAHDERFGIWGGLSERERRKLKKRAV
jgi:WhiB family transcriptional regulator, redox-sensing transcriptional regulator